ncbi:MAG TPA: phospholipase D-like domain-containing protein [Nevskiaceae bacterium]|nr:phospholipase D-like domain-containing protein [Nevskiaceae bacterium]
MSGLVLTLLLMLAASVATAGWMIITRRRRTPHLELDPDHLPPAAEAASTLAGLTGSCVHAGNRATVHQDADLFDAMLADIEAARHTVHLETFVWRKGRLETEFVKVLCRKVEQGVTVRVLIDAVGGREAGDEALERMRGAGAEVVIYCKPLWNLRRLNHRTHRKLLIVDGAIGYTFGHGVSDLWLRGGTEPGHWRDTGVRLEGPVVQALQSVFMENWIEETGCIPSGEGCFPELKRCGDVDAHVVSSDAGEAVSSVALLYTLALACARREILIQNPYFVPGIGVVKLLKLMAARGVRVRLMIPGKHTDNPFVREAGCWLYDGLMKAGIELYEYRPTLLHQKIVVVDRIWSHIGSTNFDARSLALNEEVGVGLLDAGVAEELSRAFDRDLEDCTRITPERWHRRPLTRRVMDWAAYQVHEWL